MRYTVFKVLVGLLGFVGFIVLIKWGQLQHWSWTWQLLAWFSWFVLINIAYICLYIHQYRHGTGIESDDEND